MSVPAMRLDFAIQSKDALRAEPQTHEFWRALDCCTLYSIALRRPKRSHSTAAVECSKRLKSVVSAGENAPPVETVSLYNNAALLLYHQGRLDCAARLTLDALRLCSERWERSGNPLWLACMLQPYVNFGRIACSRNDFRHARSYFQRVYEYVWKSQPFSIGPCHFTVDLLERFGDLKNEDLNLKSFAASVYLCDGAKTFLAASDFDGLLEFVDAMSRELHVFSACDAGTAVADDSLDANARQAMLLVVLELRARSLAGRGEVSEALSFYAKIVKRLPRRRPGLISVYAAIAELLAGQGRLNDARGLLQYAEELLAAFPAEPSLALEHYQAQFALALQHSCLGDLERACRCATIALSNAESCGHDVGVLRAQVIMALTQRPVSPPDLLKKCLQEVRKCTYPLERACALLELCRVRGAEKSALGSEAAEMLDQSFAWGGHLPEHLELFRRKSSEQRTIASASCPSAFLMGELESLYHELEEYALADSDGSFPEEEFYGFRSQPEV
jgi:tetratricopeptide (TPR) repeat protein